MSRVSDGQSALGAEAANNQCLDMCGALLCRSGFQRGHGLPYGNVSHLESNSDVTLSPQHTGVKWSSEMDVRAVLYSMLAVARSELPKSVAGLSQF